MPAKEDKCVMSEQKQSTGEKPEFAAYVGIDWADKKHVWALQVAATGKRQEGEVEHSPEAVEEWINALMVRFPDQPLAVCLEQSRGALLNMLSKYEQLVLFPVHPATVSRFRAALYPSGTKDDPKDAALVLDLLVHHRDRLRRLQPDTVATRQLRFLVEQRRNLVDQRTAQSNRLKSVLKQYYPQVVNWFEDLTAPLVAAFLTRWPTVETLQKARPETLTRFFHEHNCRNEELIQHRLEQIRIAVPATRDQAVIESSVVQVQWVCKIIAILCQAIADLDERIEPIAQAHPDYALFDSFPGAGEVLVPRLIAAFGTYRDRFSDAGHVQSFSGIAPVTERSGKSEWVHMRWACPKFLRQTFHEWAGHSIAYSEWARAYYHQQLAKGNGHHAAVRSLAAKWIRIVYRCWVNRTPYDEQIYLTALRLHGSPLVEAMAKAAA
jgi:transposase